MSLDIKGGILGLAAGAGILGATFSLSLSLRPKGGVEAKRQLPEASGLSGKEASADKLNRGHALFDRNCAHCHGDDARGDEGPNLHGLVKSNGRISTIIKGGIRGEMPAFGKKFTDADVEALVSYLRTLRD